LIILLSFIEGKIVSSSFWREYLKVKSFVEFGSKKSYPCFNGEKTRKTWYYLDIYQSSDISIVVVGIFGSLGILYGK
jgi:hypothetical protein